MYINRDAKIKFLLWVEHHVVINHHSDGGPIRIDPLIIVIILTTSIQALTIEVTMIVTGTILKVILTIREDTHLSQT